ncbi:hypothetical protein ACEPAI_1303 [Sanghuangporus weigelae]
MLIPCSSCILILFCLLALAAGQPQVRLGETTVNGLSIPTFGQDFFGGIPFAEPPIGALRFAPPVLRLDPGIEALNATQFGAACPQTGALFDSSSEDCLTVNVLRPAGVNESVALPVMVWVYGGGFTTGSASIYNGSGIVLQSVLRGTPIIYVNLNYRLGPLGFPHGVEAERRGATNLGNKDVITALTWVQNNIDAFGGDKEKVTIFGESAGSMIIAQLLLNQTFDLARAAILESGSAASITLLRASDHEDLWQDFVSAVPECSNASRENTFTCLRSASVESLLNATNFAAQTLIPFPPVIDGPGGIIPDLPSLLFRRGKFSRIPIITGTNLDEGTDFIPTTFNSSALLRQWLFTNTTPSPVSSFEQNFVIDGILKLYPNNPALGSPFGTGNETFGLDPAFKEASAVLGDIAFTSLRRKLAQDVSQHGTKVFAYLFTDPQTSTFPPYLGVMHSAEVVYVYGAPQNGPASISLSQNMIDYWVSFASSLDPNDERGNASRSRWTQYTSKSESVLELNAENLKMIPDNFRAEQIKFLNEHPEALLH